jgi:hypothetical protein
LCERETEIWRELEGGKRQGGEMMRHAEGEGEGEGEGGRHLLGKIGPRARHLLGLLQLSSVLPGRKFVHPRRRLDLPKVDKNVI